MGEMNLATKRYVFVCKECGVTFSDDFHTDRQFCGNACAYKNRTGRPFTLTHRLNMSRVRLGKKLPAEQKIKIGASLKGKWSREKSSRWKGGRYINKYGYVMVYAPTNPRALKSKRVHVLEHILVMEKHLGRYLTEKERIHHINGNKSDNRIENLKLFRNQSEHMFFRHYKLSTICPHCNKEFTIDRKEAESHA